MLHQKYRNRSPLRIYLSWHRLYLRRLVWSLFIFLIKALPLYALPVITAEIINLITSSGAGGDEVRIRLIKLLVLGILLIAENIPMHMYYVHLYSIPCRMVERNLRSALCTRLQHLSIGYHSSNRSGELQNKIIRDVETVESMTRIFLDVIPNIFFSISAALVVTALKAPVFLLFYLLAVPASVLVFRALRNAMQRRNREFRRSVEEMSGKVSEMLRLIPITRAHHVENVELDRVNAHFDRIKNAGLQVDYVNSVFGSVNFVVLMTLNLSVLVLVAFLYLGGKLKIGVGDIGLLATYFATITGAVMGMLNCLPVLSKGMESVNSIGEILECPDIEWNDSKPEVSSVQGEFDFENVGFSYSGSDAPALSGINLHVRPGETIALVGSSGSGKSTMANLIIGFIRPSAGRILLDGKDMNELDLRSYRTFISVVTQETLLFDGTVRENICYGINPSEKELLDAVESAGLSEFVGAMPDGLDTRVRENGARLSGGQKQRLAIARALLRNPRVLILDEATSALDIESETRIKTALDRLVKGRTTFIVAHRLSTIRNADRIAVIQHGRIAEIGTHAELLAQGGIYCEMDRKFNQNVLSADKY